MVRSSARRVRFAIWSARVKDRGVTWWRRASSGMTRASRAWARSAAIISTIRSVGTVALDWVVLGERPGVMAVLDMWLTISPDVAMGR